MFAGTPASGSIVLRNREANTEDPEPANLVWKIDWVPLTDKDNELVAVIGFLHKAAEELNSLPGNEKRLSWHDS